jgi:hypothetical protein
MNFQHSQLACIALYYIVDKKPEYVLTCQTQRVQLIAAAVLG